MRPAAGREQFNNLRHTFRNARKRNAKTCGKTSSFLTNPASQITNMLCLRKVRRETNEGKINHRVRLPFSLSRLEFSHGAD